MPPPLSIIFQNEEIVIIDKPSGLTVHQAPREKSITLLEMLSGRFPTPYIVHRLDKDTSGIIIVALNESVAFELKKQFKDRAVKKIYLAIIKGQICEDAGEITFPIKRSLRDPTKMSVRWFGGREARTRWTVLERLNNATYIEVYPLSGRTHQIRVHFAHLGHPIMGDKKYGSKCDLAIPRHMLHASQISFKDPFTGRMRHFESALPEDFKKTLKILS